MKGLRSATWPSHQRLEKEMDVKQRFSKLSEYRRHLAQMWGFCASVEGVLGDRVFRDALPDYASRRKLPLLTRDLASLGMLPPKFAASPQHLLPAISDPAAAFGCAYVLEGATLGGRTILPLVEKRLGLTANHGAAFLASYGEAVPAMWRTFSAALNRWCCLPERRSSAIGAATATFDALGHWLRREP